MLVVFSPATSALLSSSHVRLQHKPHASRLPCMLVCTTAWGERFCSPIVLECKMTGLLAKAQRGRGQSGGGSVPYTLVFLPRLFGKEEKHGGDQHGILL